MIDQIKHLNSASSKLSSQFTISLNYQLFACVMVTVHSPFYFRESERIAGEVRHGEHFQWRHQEGGQGWIQSVGHQRGSVYRR